jgi:hypothetical protein
MTSGDEEKPYTSHSKWSEDRCAKEELTGNYYSEECLSSRYLASILTKTDVTIEYNDVSPLKFKFFE